MKSLLFIESPLQLLNANEATEKFKLTSYTYYIRFSNNIKNDKQILFLVDKLGINTRNIIYITIDNRNKKILDYMKLLAYRFKFILNQEIDKVFIGNYESGFLSLITKQFNRDNIILLDDGAKTISIQDKFTASNFYHLFSMYDMTPLIGQKIYKNHYKRILKSIDRLHFNQSSILFLGMKLSEINLIAVEYYIELIKKICEFYFDKNIMYIPHRGEDRNKLEILSLNKNLSIKYIDYPVELYGMYEKNIPFKVSSFYSTALITMKNIYNMEVDSFSFDYSKSKHKDTIDAVYIYFKNKINIINTGKI